MQSIEGIEDNSEVQGLNNGENHQQDQVTVGPKKKEESIEELEKEIKQLNQDLPKDRRITSLADLNKKDPKEAKKKKGSKLIWVILGLIIVVVVILLIWNQFLEPIFNLLVDWVKSINDTSQPVPFVIFTGMLLIMILLAIPTTGIFVMLLGYVAGSFFFPFFYYLVAKLLASTIHYFFIKKFIFEKAKKKYADSLIYRVVRIESQKKPLLACLLVQGMPGPPLMRNLFITSCGVSFGSYIAGHILFSVPYGSILVLVGTSLGSSDQILNPSSFSEKSTFSKIFTVVSYSLAVLGFVFLAFVICYAKSKVKQLEAKLAKKEKRVKELFKILEEKKRAQGMESL